MGSHSDGSDSHSIREQVFKLLDKNHLLSPRLIAQILRLDYRKYGPYLRNLKSQWKSHLRNEQRSIGSPSDIHAWHGFCYLPGGLVERNDAVSRGWVRSGSRNRFLLYRDGLGRMQWFETNRVNLYVRKPAKLAKAYQLFCNGFVATNLITDIRRLESIVKSIRFKSAHFVFPTEMRLPSIQITLFEESNGIRILMGDRSHPHSVEVIASYMDWAERNERKLDKLTEFFEKFSEMLDPKTDRKPWMLPVA